MFVRIYKKGKDRRQHHELLVGIHEWHQRTQK